MMLFGLISRWMIGPGSVNRRSMANVLRGAYADLLCARKYQRQIFRTEAALEAGHKTFSQVREEQWILRSAVEKRYARLDLGTRKSGMVGAARTAKSPKHGRKAKRGQLLGGRDGRAYKAR